MSENLLSGTWLQPKSEIALIGASGGVCVMQELLLVQVSLCELDVFVGLPKLSDGLLEKPWLEQF